MKGEIVRVVMYSCLVIGSEYVFFWGDHVLLQEFNELPKNFKEFRL